MVDQLDEGSARQCLIHAPRKAWKMKVEFFMAFNSILGTWIRNLERRDTMLLASMSENLFGFSGSYAKKKQHRLAPIRTVWKRWVELHSSKDVNTQVPTRNEWMQNLQISGNIETNTDAQAVFWNIRPHGYKGSTEVVHQIFEKGPLVIYL